jgi:indolepyruvate ferredoxin oxidoreductase beta subunit
VERLTSKGRVVKTTSIGGFLMLFAVASLKPLRRRSLRHAAEQAQIESWLAQVVDVAGAHYDLAVEVAECRNLVKGYGDTHARGQENYAAIMDALPCWPPVRTRPKASPNCDGPRSPTIPARRSRRPLHD